MRMNLLSVILCAFLFVSSAYGFTGNATVVPTGLYEMDQQQGQILLFQPPPPGYGLQTEVWLYNSFLNSTDGNAATATFYLARYPSNMPHYLMTGRTATYTKRTKWPFSSWGPFESESLVSVPVPKSPLDLARNKLPGATVGPNANYDIITVTLGMMCSTDGFAYVYVRQCLDRGLPNDFCESGWMDQVLSEGPYKLAVGKIGGVNTFGLTNWVASTYSFGYQCIGSCAVTATTGC